MTTAPRYQHVLVASTILAIAVAATWRSFTQEPAGAFLFPRVIGVFFIALAVWNFIRATAGLSKVGTGLTLDLAAKIMPGLVVILVYVFFAAKALGFYVGSAIGFLSIYALCDPQPLSNPSGWIRRLAVTLGFMAVMYAMFAVLLKVHTPQGLFF